MSDIRRACVTGGAGFIGSRIVRRLLERGIEVRVIDNLSVGKPDNVPAEAELRVGDILDPEVAMGVADCDVVFHLAARVAIRSSFEFVVEDTSTNVVGTANILRAAVEPGSRVKKFILASSMAVYADSPQPAPVPETHPVEPVSPYGVSKLAAEMLVRQMCAESGIDAAVLRLFNTYGTGQALSPYVGVVTIFANAMLEGKAPTIFGDGEQRRDFVNVEDVASGFICAMDNPTGGEVFNIGSGTGLSVNEVYDTLAGILDFGLEARHEAAVPGELRNSIANIKKAQTAIGFTPEHTFAGSIAAIIQEM